MKILQMSAYYPFRLRFQTKHDVPNRTVEFTNTSQLNGGGAIMSWDWNFGDPEFRK